MIGRGERWAYAAGDVGFNFVWQTIELYLLFYYIRVLGLAPPVASAVFLAGAAVDWIADPLVGSVADRLAPRVPLRAWVAVGGPVSVVLLAAAFAAPPLGAAWQPAYAFATYVLLRFAYSLGNIPYAALTARISPRAADHLALTGTRMQGAAIGGLIAASVYALLPAATGASADFRDGALILSLLALPAFGLTWAGVRERVAAPARLEVLPSGLGATLAGMAALVRRSGALRRLLATIFCAGLAVTMVNKSLLFLFEELGERRIGFHLAVVPALSLLIAAPAWTRAAARIGRAPTLIAAAALQLAALTVALAVGGVGVVMVAVTLAIVAGAGTSIMFWALVPAAIAECEGEGADTGCAARVYALSNMARKFAQALAPQLIAATLAAPGTGVLWAVTGSAAVSLAVILAYRPRAAAVVVLA